MIVEKIKKLLALSNSPNEHEAAAAAELASSLALKYNIDLLDLQTAKLDYNTEDVQTSTKTERWISNIVSGLALVNGCRHYLAVQFDGSVRYRIVGRPESLQVIKELTTYLIAAVKRLNNEAIRQHNLSQTDRAQYRKAFRYAASQRIYQRFQERFHDLNKNDNALHQGTNALVVSNYFEAERKNIEEYLQNVKFKNATNRGISLKCSLGYQEGIEAGSTINLGDQINGVRNCRQIR